MMNTTQMEKAKGTELHLSTEARVSRRPRYEVVETAEAFEIQVSVPGVNREGIDISVEGECLNITGSLVRGIPEAWRPLRRELPLGDYRLNLRLNVPVVEDRIKAHVENGVLELSLPKADEVKPRKIRVH
ncbi:MAG: HSP20 family protein [Lentimonas sp.]|jgi:HSP20 family protein